jgi:anaerobic selenocysteine-containing dehydrogenase
VASAPGETHDAEQRMLGAIPGVPALGRGPDPDGGYSRHEYHHPAAGWGAARSVRKVIERAGEPLEAFRALFVMNHEDGGFDCPGCAWPDDPSGLRLDICENGVKHVTWELAPANADREFFAAHTVGELAGWSDYALEAVGRLVEPMSYDPASDKYEPISWEDAFALVGGTLRWHTSTLLVATNLLAIAGAVTLGALRRTQHSPVRADVGEYVAAGASAGLGAFAGSVQLLQRDVPWSEAQAALRGTRAASIARGVAIGPAARAAVRRPVRGGRRGVPGSRCCAAAARSRSARSCSDSAQRRRSTS